MFTNEDIAKAMTIRLDTVVKDLPPPPSFKKGIRRHQKGYLPLIRKRPSLL